MHERSPTGRSLDMDIVERAAMAYEVCMNFCYSAGFFESAIVAEGGNDAVGLIPPLGPGVQ